MRTIFRSIALVAALALAGAATAGPRKGGPGVYDFQLLDGGRLASKDLAGQVVVINFWATWCASCRAELPALDAYAREHRGKVKVIAVCLNDTADSRAIREAVKGYGFVTAVREGSKFSLDPLPLPSTYVFDRKGVMRKAGWRVSPYIDAAALATVVTPLL